MANAFLGNVNQITPDGSLTFDQTGSFAFNDPTSNKVFDIPTFTATQTLSPQQQALKAINDQTQTNIATVGRDQSSRIGELLGTPVQLGNEATEARLFDLGSRRLNPQFARDEETLRTRLSNQGIKAGSDPFDRALNRFDERKNDAFNQLLLRGRGQAVQEALTERNQPINEISALLSQSQVSQPNFISSNQPQIPTTDIAGIIQADFQNRVSNASVGNAFKSQLLGGLFQLGSAGITASGRPPP